MKVFNVLAMAAVVGILFFPGPSVAEDHIDDVEIRLVDVEPQSFAMIGPNTVPRFEVDVAFSAEAQSLRHSVLVSVQFESDDEGKRVSKYTEDAFEALPRISGPESGLVLTYPVEIVRQQRDLKIPVVVRVVATTPTDGGASSVIVGESEPVTFYVSEDW